MQAPQLQNPDFRACRSGLERAYGGRVARYPANPDKRGLSSTIQQALQPKLRLPLQTSHRRCDENLGLRTEYQNPQPSTLHLKPETLCPGILTPEFFTQNPEILNDN